MTTKITADNIAPNTIVASDIASGTITGTQIASSTITSSNIASGTITSSNIASSVPLGINWQSVQTSNFTAVARNGYFINTTSGAITMTLPASPSIGNTVVIRDYAGTFGTNNLTINPNSAKLDGNTGNATISTNNEQVTLTYVDATQGWKTLTNSAITNVPIPLFVSATGGTVLTNSSYKTHVFTGCSTFVVSCAGNSLGSTSVEYLVVAGGGSGGSSVGGGGGAGGYRQIFPSPSTGGLPVSATTYPVTVGAGGSLSKCAPQNSPTGFGSPSSFSTITSAGGGR